MFFGTNHLAMKKDTKRRNGRDQSSEKRSRMTNLEWLLKGDPVICHLVRKYLMDEPSVSDNQGFIQRYLACYDPKTKLWGNGYYGPKWISTHYTLLDLVTMEIVPDTLEYQESLSHYLDHYWEVDIDVVGIKRLDLCIAGMFIRFLAYGRIQDKRLKQLIDFVLETRMPDGGWNCAWFRHPYPKISSVHTTINVLEGLSEYLQQGYSEKSIEVELAIEHGIQVLLDRQLIYQKHTTIPIHPHMAEHHFPTRWKYDYLRILEFLAKERYPECDDIQPALTLLESKLLKGKLTKGTTIPGKTHFPLETESFGRFNTCRAYVVLKFYRPALFQQSLTQEF